MLCTGGGVDGPCYCSSNYGDIGVWDHLSGDGVHTASAPVDTLLPSWWWVGF